MKIYITIAILAFALGSGFTLSITKAVKPTVKLECPQPICPEFKCPANNGIDYDKIKNVRGLTINNTQLLEVDGDSVTVEMIKKALEQVVKDQRVVRCR